MPCTQLLSRKNLSDWFHAVDKATFKMQPIKQKSMAATLMAVILGLILSIAGAVESSNPERIFLPIIFHGNDVKSIGPDGGHIVSIAIDPNNASVIYAGTWGAGIYKSMDGGQSWTLMNSGLGNYYVNTVVIDPTNTSTIYAGTQTDGVYKSTNGGGAWASTGPGLNQDAIVYTIAIDPSTPTTLYAGTRSPGSQPPWGGGMYKSVDGGDTWQERNQGLGEEWVYSIAINPVSPNTLYAATHTAGVYKSVDGAANWSAVNNGVLDLSTRSLVIDPDNPQKVLVGTWHNWGVFRTTNGGVSWSQVSVGLSGVKIFRLEMDPSNSQIIYASTWRTGVYKTVNGGDVWISSGLWPDFVYDVAVDPDTNSNVFVGTAGDGVYKSSNAGGNWSRSDTGLKATYVTSLVLDSDSPLILYASIYGGGVYKSTNRGETWAPMNSGLEDKWVHSISMAPDNPLTLYAATDSSGMYVSFDGGGSWNSANLGFPSFSLNSTASKFPFNHLLESEYVDGGLLEEYALDVKEFPSFSFGGTNLSVQTIEIVQNTPSTIYIGTNGDGVYKSLNSGSNWNATGHSTGYVNGLAIDPTNPSIIFAGVRDTDGSMLKTFDGGTNWIFMNTGLNGQTIYAVEFDPSTPSKLIAGSKDGVYLSTNSGNSWSSTSLSGVAVYSLEINSSDSNLIYAGTAEGFYISSDGGSNWELEAGRLVNPIVQSLELDYNGSRIYLGSQGSGSYRRNGMLP